MVLKGKRIRFLPESIHKFKFRLLCLMFACKTLNIRMLQLILLTLTLVFKASVKHSNWSEYRFLSHKVLSVDSLSFQWHHEAWDECYHGCYRKWQNIVRNGPHACKDTGTFSHENIQGYQCLSLSVRLLDVIAGRKDPAGLKEGRVLLDGKAITADLRLSSAYVVQVINSKKLTFFFKRYCT